MVAGAFEPPNCGAAPDMVKGEGLGARLVVVVWAPKLNTLLGAAAAGTVVAVVVVVAAATVVEEPNAWATEEVLKGKARAGVGLATGAASESVLEAIGVKADDPDPKLKPPDDASADESSGVAVVSLLPPLKNPPSVPPPTATLLAVLAAGC